MNEWSCCWVACAKTRSAMTQDFLLFASGTSRLWTAIDEHRHRDGGYQRRKVSESSTDRNDARCLHDDRERNTRRARVLMQIDRVQWPRGSLVAPAVRVRSTAARCPLRNQANRTSSLNISIRASVVQRRTEYDVSAFRDSSQRPRSGTD